MNGELLNFPKVPKLSGSSMQCKAISTKNSLHLSTDTSFCIKFENGHQKVIADSIFRYGRDGEPLYTNYEYVGQYPNVGLYLTSVYNEYAEIPGGAYQLVNKVDGTEYQCSLGDVVIPVLSPDKLWMASIYSGDCGSVMGMSIIVNDGKQWHTAFEFELPDQMANQVVWGLQPNELFVAWNNYAQYDGNGPSVKYYKIIFDGQY